MNVQGKHFYVFGRFRFDPEERLLVHDGEPVPLAPKVAQTLLLLVQNAGHLLEKEDLLKRIWPDAFVEEGSLNKNIFLLRRVLSERDRGREYIETVPKRGYRFVVTVNQVLDAKSGPLPQLVDAASLNRNTVSRGASAGTAAVVARNSIESEGRAESLPIWRRSPIIGLAGGVLALFSILGVVVTHRVPTPKVLDTVQITNDGRQKSVVVTDGARIYFVEVIAGGTVLAQVAASGGETVVIPTSLQVPTILDISPARSELLISAKQFLGESPLTILPIPAGPPRPLGSVIGHDGTWSPDGRRILYASGSDLYLTKNDGTESRKLVTTPGIPRWPRWSPDGHKLRFTVLDEKTNSASVWEVSAEGTKLHPLLPAWNNPSAECCGSWTPDGKYYVFLARQNRRIDIWAIREKGDLFRKANPEPVQLTFGPMDTFAPVPSTDGKKVFFIGQVPRAELVRYDSKSGQFAPYLSGISAGGVDFSRDSKWVVYWSYPDGTLWRSRVDGTDRLQLTYPPMVVVQASWAPDGKRIAFHALEPGRPEKIYIVSVDGGISQQAIPGEENESDPAWSPNGNFLAFGGLVGSPPHSLAIHVFDFQSHQVRTLPGSEGLFAPSWSPDGRYILGQPTDNQKLFLFDVRSKKWTKLVDLPAVYYIWSRDGKFVYFDVWSTSQPAIYRVRVADGKIELVADLKGRRPLGPAMWLGLAPDGSPLLPFDAGVQEVYALNVNFP
jgi:Tol biopolymer transport system component/DNA-binding winged helix-turn-helix (wHTH) protein